MTRYALIAALLACLGLGAALWWMQGQRDNARAEAARLTRELVSARLVIEQRDQAIGVHRIYLQRAQAAAREAAQAEVDILQEVGADAPLSPLLRRVLDRVR